MTRILFALGLTLVVAACGVDGEPVRPSLNAGIGVSSSGVHAGGSVGLSKGPLSVSLGL
ncbi:hypothetical protein [Phaeobacter italicus]|jgi:hypothetical protein|uniref:Uncharacterized protein n=1 Tax=Phaeobacter italicus TaxID=481446 RepID=A0A0H5CYW3_9RHOB|nr:hypothetical protein [Phaeobacter italicus]EEB72188.1 lipoprotein, putative [Ruegeria sp. R11]MEC8015240.1 hypothetical protein [Pseudomonadota bacterium]NKX42480.1 hypothetical protein [Rhodobacteraceae bacterium R_SAG2]MBO9442278.1 hypothetical protein [Phaeobacter italicus]MBY5975987.1 hypothetical protein [Phaeobacter italicus]